MTDKERLKRWVHDALMRLGGRGTLLQVAKDLWQHHEKDLHDAGDLFYTWQYMYRWSATELRKEGKMKAEKDSPSGVWELTDHGKRG